MNGLLCLKWNNHSSSLLKKLSVVRTKESYCDATIACQGKYYPVHRLVLSTCSEYFEEIFDRTQCRHPFIIVKDIAPLELEALLSYMYNGEVNVLQDTLSGLIKAAETLRIKGLAVSDERNDSPKETKKRFNTSISSSHSKRACRRSEDEIEEASIPSPEPQNLSEYDETLPLANCESELARPDIRSDPPVVDIKVEAFEFHDQAEENADDYEEDYDHSNPNRYPHSEASSAYSPEHKGPIDIPTTVLSLSTENKPIVKTEIDGAQCSSWDRNTSADSNSGSTQDEAKDFSTSSNTKNEKSSNQKQAHHVAPVSPPRSLNLLPLPARLLNSVLNRAKPNQSRPYKCLYCPLTFQNKTNLNHHLNTHTGERPFPCPVCPYKATQLTNLKKHALTHTGEKPFKCSFCDYTARQNVNIKRHMRRHHNRNEFAGLERPNIEFAGLDRPSIECGGLERSSIEFRGLEGPSIEFRSSEKSSNELGGLEKTS